jgi:putative transposase
VKHGLTAVPVDWEASSVHWYLEKWGVDSLNDLWRDYPLLAYGKGWDD